jgi:hypothetical protein
MRDWLRSNPAWVSFRRLQREGFLRAFRRWRAWSRILATRPVATSPGGDTEVHLLCYRNDYLCALWALKSFYHFSGSALPLVIHTQGHAPPRMLRRLREHFPNARIITQPEADSIVLPKLRGAGLTKLIKARAANHYTLKLTDFLLLGEAPNLLTLDSDILFFRKPEAFLAANDRHLFQRDPESTYVFSPEQARAELGIELAPCINVGMMHFRRDSISLARCDQYLAHFQKLDGWLEQTLYALHASEQSNAAYLPPDYLISLAGDVDHSKLIARHYAGPSRPLLHEQGIPHLAPVLIPR